MSSTEAIAQSHAWHSGENKQADEALNLARDALQAKDLARCFACVRGAMTSYGWEFHSDKKARRLWDMWDRINGVLRKHNLICDAKTASAIESLYHETYRAVHFDRNKKIRRHLPPRDPSARIEPVVPVAGLDFGR
jgi:hypothetical protein